MVFFISQFRHGQEGHCSVDLALATASNDDLSMPFLPYPGRIKLQRIDPAPSDWKILYINESISTKKGRIGGKMRRLFLSIRE